MLYSFRKKLAAFILNPRGYLFDSRTESAPTPCVNLAGDRQIEWGWCLANMRPPEASGLICIDFGPGHASYLGLGAHMLGYRVIAVDLTRHPRHYLLPDAEWRQGDALEMEMPEKADLLLNCSTIEHVGLPDSYGNAAVEDGDLRMMNKLQEWMLPQGMHLCTVPVGVDAVYPGKHRVYGEKRLPRLLNGWHVEHSQYWCKNSENQWENTPQDIALRNESQPGLYGLGLFILRTKAVD